MPVPTPPTAPSAPPTAPQRTDSSTFPARMDAWLTWFNASFWLWLYDLVPWIQNRANETEGWANSASTSAANAAASAAGIFSGNNTYTGTNAFTQAPTIEGVMTGRGGGGVGSNTRYGLNALYSNTTGVNNTASGVDALRENTTGSSNTASGFAALNSNTTGYNNTASGLNSLFSNTTGYNNTASGVDALYYNTTGNYNTANGHAALNSNTTGYNNTANGHAALLKNTTGYNNTASGIESLQANTTGSGNAGYGIYALYSNTTGIANAAFGANSLSAVVSYSNCAGLGYESQVTGSNQVQLGNSSTTTYVYGTVQNRSDLRDKADVRDTVLGLAFIKALRPVDYRWDMREDYRPARPADLPKDATEAQKEAHKAAMAAWIEACKHENIVRDGSKKRGRFHHGLIAQEVEETMRKLKLDFGGYQDHARSGGHDVKSIGYDELIAPLIKSVQELAAQNAALAARIAALEAK